MKQKISDLIVSGLLKRGILWEAKTFETDIVVPIEIDADGEAVEGKLMTINIKCENMTIRIDKE